MPVLMLGKCGKAQGVRAAYPATDGLYIQEEFMVEQYEPSEQAKLQDAKITAKDAEFAKLKELGGGKITDEQVGLLEQGQTAEEILLQASLHPKEPKQAEIASGAQQMALGDIWPKGPKLSTQRGR